MCGANNSEILPKLINNYIILPIQFNRIYIYTKYLYYIIILTITDTYYRIEMWRRGLNKIDILYKLFF